MDHASSSSAIVSTLLFTFLFGKVETRVNTTTSLTIPLAKLLELHRLGVSFIVGL